MKAIEWKNYLDEQYRRNGKAIYTATELANSAGVSLGTFYAALPRLKGYGVIEQFCHGRYGLPGGVTPGGLVRSLDSHAYVTGLYVLYENQLITQVPVNITCFTDRRHNRSRVRATTVGTLTFVCVAEPLYSPPQSGGLVSAEQALCDYVYLVRRHGADPRGLVTFRHLERLDEARLEEHLSQYPDTVKRLVAAIA